MSTVRAFLRQHSVLAFYVIVFAISWGGFYLAVGPTTSMPVVELPLAAVFAMVAGPIVATLVMTGVVYGEQGYRNIWARLRTWRVAASWYAFALLVAPLVIATVYFGLSLFSPLFLPGIVKVEDKVAYLIFNLIVAVVAGFLEEIGWTGFAIPEVRRRHGVFATGLIVGTLWGAWHFLGNVAAAENVSGPISLYVYLPLILSDLLFGTLVAFRVLMVWVYDHTNSLLVAMLMHVSLTASVRIFSPVPNEGGPLLLGAFVTAVVMWAVVVAIALVKHGHLTQQPRYEEMSVASH